MRKYNSHSSRIASLPAFMATNRPPLSDAVIDGTAPSGTAVGAYILDGVLGRGSFGVVYRAHNAAGDVLAIKVAAKTRNKKTKGLTEAILSPEYTAYRCVWERTSATPASRKHFALDWMPRYNGSFANAATLELPLVGATLDLEPLPLPWPNVRKIAGGVLDALAVLHDIDYVYLDLKPANVAVTDGIA